MGVIISYGPHEKLTVNLIRNVVKFEGISNVVQKVSASRVYGK